MLSEKKDKSEIAFTFLHFKRLVLQFFFLLKIATRKLPVWEPLLLKAAASVILGELGVGKSKGWGGCTGTCAVLCSSSSFRSTHK